MSKEEYLKGEKKEKVLGSIQKYIAYRMDNDEMINNLKDLGYDISERTLRRYKQEIRDNAGNTISEIYRYGYFVLGQVIREAEVKVKCGIKTQL